MVVDVIIEDAQYSWMHFGVLREFSTPAAARAAGGSDKVGTLQA